MPSITPTIDLCNSELFARGQEPLLHDDKVKLAHRRAQAIAGVYDITKDDIKLLSAKFFALHADPLQFQDTSAALNITVHYNVALGTIIDEGGDRKDLQGLIDDLLAYRKNAQFLLTEQGHGLDVVNMETRATLLKDGTFDLHSPTPQAAKFMPSTVPVGIPCVGVVMARLVIEGVDHGVRAFVVKLNDGIQMCTGVRARKLPPRGDTEVVNHSLTSFHHVNLPSTALLGSLPNSNNPKSKPENRDQFLSVIRRVPIGSFILSALAIPNLQLVIYTAAKYSQRRMVQAAAAFPYPIWSLKTQQTPILCGFADSFVFKALVDTVIPKFRDPRTSGDILRAYAALCKILFYKHHQELVDILIGRLGAQGVFNYNRLTTGYGVIRGYSIGEGENLALSVRLATELLLRRYSLGESDDPSSFLARHEIALFRSCRQTLSTLPSHRSSEFNELLIPRCQGLIEALAQRLAYDAAKSSGVHPAIVDLFEAQSIQTDLGWYIENGLITRDEMYSRSRSAQDACLPLFEAWLKEEESGIGKYVVAPIVDQESWNKFVDSLPEFSGSASAKL